MQIFNFKNWSSLNIYNVFFIEHAREAIKTGIANVQNNNESPTLIIFVILFGGDGVENPFLWSLFDHFRCKNKIFQYFLPSLK